jgi:hypothetical protein
MTCFRLRAFPRCRCLCRVIYLSSGLSVLRSLRPHRACIRSDRSTIRPELASMLLLSNFPRCHAGRGRVCGKAELPESPISDTIA